MRLTPDQRIKIEQARRHADAARFMIDEIGDDGVPADITRKRHSEGLSRAVALLEEILRDDERK